MEDGGRLNNNVLIFDPGHWFLVICLQVQLKTIIMYFFLFTRRWSPVFSWKPNYLFPYQEMMTNYNPSVYEANGPQLISRVFNSLTGDFYLFNQSHCKRLEIKILFHVCTVFHPWQIALIRSKGCDRPCCRHISTSQLGWHLRGRLPSGGKDKETTSSQAW